MAEGTAIEDDVKKKVPLRPPNRRRHEEQLEQLMQSIRSLEAELKSLGRPQQVDGSSEDSEQRDLLLAEQKRLREEKEACISKRKSLDEELKAINELISRQSDTLSKLDAGLAFKTETAVDDAVRKLEYQLATRHFKLSEENRIVKEIDSLRRSKKKVKEYLQQKQQIDVERARKKTMKDEREKYFRLVSSLKAQEDEVKKKLIRNKSKTDEAWSKYREAGPKREALKKEIDDLYERRRQLTSEFRQQNSKYHIQQKQQRADSFRRKEEEKRAQEEARKKQWQQYEASREPYQDERQLCSALIRYLHRYLSPDHELPLGASALSPVQSPTVSVPSLVSGRDEEMKMEGDFVILKKKGSENENVFLPATSAKKKRGIRKSNRKPSWLSKPIAHTAQIFSQFEMLGLRAPSSMSEVPDAISHLTARKEAYETPCQDTSPASQTSGAAARPESSTMLTNTPSALHQDATLKTTCSDPQCVLTNHELEEPDNDCLSFSLMKLASKLPRIDIQSAQDHSMQRQANSTPGLESAPETPNSEGSIAREAEGDLESVDSGIGIHRLKGFVSGTSTHASQDLKGTDTNVSTVSGIQHDHEELTSQTPVDTKDALLSSNNPLAQYIEGDVVSILREKPAQLGHEGAGLGDLMAQDTPL